MSYEVKKILKEKDIASCNTFAINTYNWGGDYRPKTYGQIGLLPDGLYIKMVCAESFPATTFFDYNKPVYQDSALEFFIRPTLHTPLYFNFEMNSAGALLAQCGSGKEGRLFLSDDYMKRCACTGSLTRNSWAVTLTVPISLLPNMDHFYFNAYKIKESPGQTHFGSCYPVDSPQPNFHLPQFFQKAQII